MIAPLSPPWFRALGLSWRAHLRSAPHMLKIAVFPLLLSLMGLVFLLTFAHMWGLGADMAPTDRPMPLGSRLAHQIAQRMSATPQTPKLESLSGYTVHIQGSVERARLATTAVHSLGGRVSAPPTDLLLRHTPTGWELTATHPETALLVFPALSAALSQAVQDTKAMSTTDLMGVTRRANMDKHTQTLSRYSSEMLTTAVAWGLMAPLLLMVWLSCAKSCSDTNRARSAGLLEAFVLSPMPFHIYMLGQALAQGLIVGLLALVMMCLAGLFVGFMHPVSWLAVGLIVGVMSTCMVLLGGLQVLWFHHPKSAVVGSFLLNPLASPFALLLVLWVLSFTSLSPTGNVDKTADTLMRAIPIMNVTPNQALLGLAVTAVVCTVFMAVLCVILEARLGARRTGLARV